MKLIPITQGYFVQVDDEDFERLSKVKWQASVRKYTVYAINTKTIERGKTTTIMMHRAILGVTDPKVYVDHRDGDGLNNCRINIRRCTPAENVQNRAINKNSKSGIKGVRWNKQRSKWTSQLCHNKKRYFIGHFDDKSEAEKAYKEKAMRLFGD